MEEESTTPPASPPPAKKSKKTPLKQLRVGENMVDIKLLVVASDAVRLVRDSKVYTFVATDGFDFVNVTCWENSVERIIRSLGTDYLGRTFAFRGFGTSAVAKEYNYGSVDFELKPRDGSELIMIKSPEHGIDAVDSKDFFVYLASKFALDESEFHPTKIGNVKKDEKFIEVEAELIKTSLRSVKVKGNDSKVCDVQLVAGKKKTLLTGWNIMADFLDQFLRGKEGSLIKLQGIVPRESPQKEITFLFTQLSRIAVSQKIINSGNFTSLISLKGSLGLCSLNIRLSVARSVSVSSYSRKEDGTVCSDGKHKCQFIFPNSIKFRVGDEFLVKNGNINWSDGGVLTISIYSSEAITVLPNKEIGKCEIGELDYPE